MEAKKTYKWRDLPKGLVTYSIPTKIVAMMGGVSMAKQDGTGKITLTYQDNSTESADLPNFELIDMDNEAFFSVISAVQDKRATNDI